MFSLKKEFSKILVFIKKDSIRKAFRKKALKIQPDKNKHTDAETEKPSIFVYLLIVTLKSLFR